MWGGQEEDWNHWTGLTATTTKTTTTTETAQTGHQNVNFQFYTSRRDETRSEGNTSPLSGEIVIISGDLIKTQTKRAPSHERHVRRARWKLAEEIWCRRTLSSSFLFFRWKFTSLFVLVLSPHKNEIFVCQRRRNRTRHHPMYLSIQTT